MEYKRFTIKTIEREPGKWRASIQRTNGKPLWAGRAKIRHFVTGRDATTPQRAMQMALAAIDRGAFSRQPVGVAPASVRGGGTPGPQARHVNGRPIDKCSLSDVLPRKRRGRPNAPFAELVGLSRTSIADEMLEEHRRRVLGEVTSGPGRRPTSCGPVSGNNQRDQTRP